MSPPQVTPASIIYGLAAMTWRAIDAPPYDVAGFRFSHSQAKKQFPYINGAAHDWVGLDAIPMAFTLYFLNTLKKDAFPALWEEWRIALFDGSPGKLQHPLLGEVDAVVTEGSVDLQAKTTAGVIVAVTFEQTILRPEQAIVFDGLRVAAKDVANASDAELQKLGITYPTGAPGSTSFFNLIGQIEGAIQAAQLSAFGKIRQLQANINTVLGLLTLPSHAAWAAIALMKQLYAISLDLEAAAGKDSARSVTSRSYPHDMTFGDVASATGNTVAEILGLNLRLANAPLIPAGTAVAHYR